MRPSEVMNVPGHWHRDWQSGAHSPLVLTSIVAAYHRLRLGPVMIVHRYTILIINL
jgi:hypothetical protein